MRNPFQFISAKPVLRLVSGIAVAGLLWSVGALAQNRPKFLADDPLQREPDTQDASKVQEWDIGLLADLTMNLFSKQGDPALNVRAGNINTIDEVPDSNWFTNRIYARDVTIDEITRGPNTSDGPAKGKWIIIRPKSAGVSPGFTIRDEKGETWFVSFDARGNPVAATAVVAVAMRLFWALGYFQVESHIVTIRPEDIVIGDTAMIRAHGRRRRMVQSDLNDVLRRSERSDDGSYRAVVGRAVAGRPVGGFKYFGTRPDDPNDVVPHEHRRELRALKVFGAWTNLVDMKAGNTLDTVITENGRGVVRHYLQDVGSTFGTGALGPRDGDEGHEYLYEADKVFKRLFSLGLYIQPWQTLDYEKNAEIGKFSADGFEPDKWVPRVPVVALRHARPDDTLWAALRVMAFTDAHIQAAVKTGIYTDPAAEKLLSSVLGERRDQIGKTYTALINPLVKFALDESGMLTFENPAVRAKYWEAPKGGYSAMWARYDNAAGQAQVIGVPTPSGQERIQGPGDLPRTEGSYLKVSVSAMEPLNPAWARPVDAYFKRTGNAWKLVGIDRVP